jgi:hypothetical protein
MIGNGKKSEDGLMDWKEWGWHNGHISTPPNLVRQGSSNWQEMMEDLPRFTFLQYSEAAQSSHELE